MSSSLLEDTEYTEYEIKDTSNTLPPERFLSLPRPDVLLSSQVGAPDTTTLAAHDFDLDNRTGFLPPQPPLQRLPIGWESWEAALDKARNGALQLGSKPDLTSAEAAFSESWRQSVRQLVVLSIDGLEQSDVMLRRAHHVLTFINHMYIHSLPEDVKLIIPRSISIPLLQVSQRLSLPPVLTYSDEVLYNWDLIMPSDEPTPSPDNLRCQTLITETSDEEHFHLTSTKIELRGVKALEIMRSIMDDLFVDDDLATRQITDYLTSLASIISDMRTILLAVKEGVRPEVFYHQIRPWLRGADPEGRQWEFEGLDDHPELENPTKLAGSSAGQSSSIHSMDIFLGSDQEHEPSRGDSTSTNSRSRLALLEEMRNYMPLHHRRFLDHLKATPRPLRKFVLNSGNEELVAAYNLAVKALKEFRDAHLIIIALFIVGPSRKAHGGNGRLAEARQEDGSQSDSLKGTAGTDLVKFLKGVRDRTKRTLVTPKDGGWSSDI